MKRQSSGGLYPPRFWPALIIFSLTGQVAWVVENMYFNVFIYKMFHASAGEISLMVAASAVAATLTTIFVGAFSDMVGRRKVFICAGYILWGISILSFALIREDVIRAVFGTGVSVAAVGVTLVIVMDCVMTFFGSTANDACFNAWLTDATARGGRGAAEGVNAMMPLIAILVVFGGFMSFDLERQESWVTIFAVIGGAVLVIGLLGFFLLTETGERKAENQSYWGNIFYGFRPSVVRENPALYLTLAGFVIFNISIQIFMPYLILYYDVSLGMDNYVLVMAPAILLAAVVTVFAGKYYDKTGFLRSVVPALLALMAGYVVLTVFRATVPVFLGSLLMMSGYLSGMAVFGAMIREKIPEGKAGMFQGLRIFAQVLVPGVIGPAIGAAVLRDAAQIVNDDGTMSFVPNVKIFIAALVAAAAVLVFVAAARKAFTQEVSR
ncbi:MAG: MFS transporter [Lachnospiraceae bacterium]|nr:MFS transporter [Lachnospiraceae bacterium]